MKDKPVDSIRKTLVIIGLILLVIVGARAASQARDMRLAGAVHHQITSAKNNVLGFLGVSSGDQQAVTSAVVVPTSDSKTSVLEFTAQTQTKKTTQARLNSQSTNTSANSPTNTNETSLRSNVNKTTNTATKNVEKVQEGVDDLNRIWP